MKKLLLMLALLLTGCVDKPKNIEPVENFKLASYLGTWYEIARLDHRFERGLEQISATYSLREDGGVKVLNKGYKTQDEVWSEAEGKAYFVESPDKGFLKVSFFGPFYGSYIVMDTDYETYTMISGPDLSYLWILSRTPKLDEATLSRLVKKAKALGFDTSKLIYPKQHSNN
ncbi:lipocalin family protein [Sulfurovum sp.]|uniref:lipocalin family protein n=1 Tax=Sulfurovum sp. TaxID=1969726 RepID=UPI0028683950|nr:lipocalin family protein [Sulfurovum sp.]